ncbi:type II toxin-antitoxin system PemK/MazF family toxin [Faecalicoccus pleomorphus]|uniref:type II toxin-antitoxin system PemK/MazF family toxin n=1 Tax=Faecalicoccus pleomorphus TaxID=1323 RepID=UPI0029423895|nr:type II toxin-antitoxin system PemK/MazF family toxin [Faecalicoccus pleomorphus]
MSRNRRKKIQQSKKKNRMFRQREKVSLYDYESFFAPKIETTEQNLEIKTNEEAADLSGDQDKSKEKENMAPTVSSNLAVLNDKTESTTIPAPVYNGPIRQGDVFWARFSYPMRPKESKIRPVVVVQDNTSFNTLTVVPLTSSQVYADLCCRIPLQNDTLCYAEVDCLTTIDRKMICNYQRTLTDTEYRKIIVGILDHLGLFLKHYQ